VTVEKTWNSCIHEAATNAGFGEPRVKAILNMWEQRPKHASEEKNLRMIQLACEIARPESIIRLRDALLHVQVLDVQHAQQPSNSVAWASYYYVLATAAEMTSTLESVLNYNTSLLRMYDHFCEEYYNQSFGLIVDEQNKNINSKGKCQVTEAIARHLEGQCGAFERILERVKTSINNGRNLKIILSGLESLSIFLPSDPMLPPLLNLETYHPFGSRVASLSKPFNPMRLVTRRSGRTLT
jgi:hypothetical protein